MILITIKLYSTKSVSINIGLLTYHGITIIPSFIFLAHCSTDKTLQKTTVQQHTEHLAYSLMRLANMHGVVGVFACE